MVYDRATSARDLAIPELWERSQARSLQRRRLTELGRRARRRRKSASLAVSAALAAVPVLPRGVAAADSGSGASTVGANTYSNGVAQASSSRVVLEVGNEGNLVAAAQERLNEVQPLTHLAVDGIYGPLTQGAVTEFQRAHGLMPTGAIDVGTWAVMFKAPVLVMGGMSTAGSTTGVNDGSSSSTSFVGNTVPAGTTSAGGNQAVAGTGAGTAPNPGSSTAGQTGTSSGASGSGSRAAVGGTSGSSTSAPAGGGAATTPQPSSGNQPIAVVSPSNPTTQPSTYVLTNGVALPLPRQYIVNGYVDQGVDYSAPGGTPEYAMGSGVIIGEGISGFGPNAPILKITSGPLTGLEVYYGHAGTDLVQVGQHVTAGQQITEVGYGIVGISTGPHLEIGFYPPGPMGAGSRMLSLINSLLSQHPSGRVWGSSTSASHTVRIATSKPAASSSAPASSVPPATAGPAGEPAASGGTVSNSSPVPASNESQATSYTQDQQAAVGGATADTASAQSNSSAAAAAEANSQSNSNAAAVADVQPNSASATAANVQSNSGAALSSAPIAASQGASAPAQPQMQVQQNTAPQADVVTQQPAAPAAQPIAPAPQTSSPAPQKSSPAPQTSSPAPQAAPAPASTAPAQADTAAAASSSTQTNTAATVQSNTAAAPQPSAQPETQAASTTPAASQTPAASETPAASTTPAEVPAG